MSNRIELSPYDHVGHDSWREHKNWMFQPNFDGKTLPEDKVQILVQRALGLGMSERDIQQAIYEGGIAAQIQFDPNFASTQSISGLKEKVRVHAS